MLRLYDFELSADCYVARLMLSAVGAPYETIPVDVYPGRETETATFRSLNSAGTVPVLVDGDRALVRVADILLYLAHTRDQGRTWLPEDAAKRAATMAWLAFATALAASLGVAREIVAMDRDADLGAARSEGHRLLRELDEHLWFGEQRGDRWLVAGDVPTIADIACFPPVALAEDGGVSRQDYPAVRRWLDRVRRISGFVTMPGVFAGGPAHPDGP